MAAGVRRLVTGSTAGGGLPAHAPTVAHLASFPSLLAAFRRARRAQRGRGGEPAFFVDLEERLLDLREALLAGVWVPREYRRFRLWTGKERVVAQAAFVDRVVHHALVAELAPAFEPRFSPHSYACRPGLGVKAALERARGLAASAGFSLRLDVQRYFETVDHGVLMGLLGAGLARAGPVDAGLLDLCARVLDAAPSGTGGVAGVGLPIGNLTSQFWANVTLDPVDQAIEGGGCTTWSRYMDDMLALADTKGELWAWQRRVREVVEDELKLRLKPSATRVAPIGEGFPWLGFNVLPGRVRIRSAGKRRFARKLQAATARAMAAAAAGDAEGELREAARGSSLTGHLLLADTLALRRSLVSAITTRVRARRDRGS